MRKESQVNKMDLSNFIDTGKKKKTFKAIIGNLRFFVSAYDEKQAKEIAKKKIEEEHKECINMKFAIKSLS